MSSPPRRLTRMVVLGLLLGAMPLAAQDARIASDVDTTLVTVGDRIHLTVTVEHAAGARVVWPDSLDLSPFEVLAAEGLPPSAAGDRVRSSAVLTLTAFELGALEIPSFEVQVAGPGDALQALATDRFGIEVLTVGADEGGDIRGIRGPLWIPVSVVRVGLWLLLFILAAGVAYWFARRRRDAEDPGARTAGPPPRPPHEVALEALDRIEASPLLERGQVKEYHIAVSEALRTYVEGRFQVPALEMTTREVVTGLHRRAAPSDFIDGLTGFLDRCDMVKFAKVRPDAETSRTTLAVGRTLVEGSIPAAVEAPEPATVEEEAS